MKNILTKQATSQKQYKERNRRRFFGGLGLVGAAAALCVVLLTNSIFAPDDGGLGSIANAFTFRVYAVEYASDGAITRREVNMNEQVGGFHGHHDGERIFISIGLGFEGDNIKTVEFIAQKGVFATQHMSNFDKNKPHSGFSTEYGGRRVLMLGYNFEMAGERLVFEQNYIDNDLLIFWSIEADRNDFIPSDAEFMVIVTFDDGEVIYDMFTINFGDRFGMITIYTSEEEQAAMLAASIREWEFYSNLSLDEMVHVADAVITRVPQYDEMFGGVEMYSACFGIMISFYDRDGNLVEFVQPATRFSHNFMEFDERGMVLWEINHSEDGVSSYIAFFMQDDYGNISFRRFLAPRFAE